MVHLPAARRGACALRRERAFSSCRLGHCMLHPNTSLPQVFGGNVVRAPCGVMHGKTSPVFHTNTGLLEGLDNPFK